MFLDRDGVLNHAILVHGKPYPPRTLDELVIAEDAPQALTLLNRAGYLLLGVTNQPDVSRGILRREVVEAIHSLLLSALPLQEILVCYHDDGDGCLCRKPFPGLLYRAAERFSLDLSSCFMVGDRWKDVEAGRRGGCSTILIERRYSEEGPRRPPDRRVRSLTEAAAWILTGQGGDTHELVI